MTQTIGQKLSPILEEIEDTLWESEARTNPQPPQYPIEAVRAGIKIFSSIILDKLWEKQEKDGVEQGKRESEARLAGVVISKLVLDLTGIDTKKLYKK